MKTKQKLVTRTLKHLQLCLTSVILFIGLHLTGQADFLSDVQQQRSYYDSIISERGADSMQGTGYTQFQRRYRYWAPKLSSSYDYSDYQTDLINYANSYTDNQNGNSAANWLLIGPNDIPDMGSSAKGTGQIHYIYKSPFDDEWDNIYACSPVGGLFRSNDRGVTWKNAGTDKGLPRPGVSSIVIDYKIVNDKPQQCAYITTGNGEGFDNEIAWQTAIGVWRSFDNCNTWESIGLTSDNSGQNIFHMRKVIKIENYTDSTHIIVTTTEGLFESRNANKETPSWNKLINGEFYDVVQDFSNSNLIFASGSNNTGIYKYDLINNVSTKIFDIDTITLPYDTMTILKPELRRISLKISPSDSNYLFAVVSMRDYNYTAVYRYNIANQVWHRFYAPASFNGYARKLGWAIRPKKNNDGKMQILGRDDFTMKLINNVLSNDVSTTNIKVENYDNIDPHDDFHFLIVEENDSTIWAGTDGGIYKGEFINDSVIKWESRNFGLGVSTIEHIDASSDGKLVTSGQFDCGSNTYFAENEADWDIVERTHGDGYKNIIVDNNSYFVSANSGRIREYNNMNSMYSRYVGNFPKRNTDCSYTGDTIPCANFSTYYTKLDGYLYVTGEEEVRRFPSSSGQWENWSNFNSQIGCAISGTWRIAAKKNNGIHQIYVSARQEDANYHFLYKSIDGGGPSTNSWVKINNTPKEGFINAIEITNNTDSVLIAIRDSIFSVNTSNPTSPIWSCLSYGLDANNINSIDRYNSRTWIGTERGVYYLEDGSNVWVDYTSNLPNCEVKEIRVRNNRVYAGTYGRGVWVSSAPSCDNIMSDYYISESNNVVYSGITKQFFRNVIVPTGITYNVYGKIQMASNCKIVVQRGAKLVIDGGIITKACPDFWKGIELWGNSNAVQDTINQGWVILKNGATIEYAEQGISTVKNDSVSSDLSYAGGVIQADSAYFINNTNSITMFPYPKAYGDFSLIDNQSYFKRCKFTYDSSYYYFDDNPLEHVSLSDVVGVLFESNIFENKVSSYFSSGKKRGTGILGWNSGFYLLKGEDASKGNIFYDLDYGVKSYSYTGNNKSIIIDQNEFNHNRTGCLLSAETYAYVVRNSFNITTSGIGLADGYTGLYLDASTGYTIEENNFYSTCNPYFLNTYSRSYGMVINCSGPDENIIYNNSFNNLGVGTHVQDVNRSKDGLAGLVLKCNDYQLNYQDINVTYYVLDDNDGLKYYQGTNSNLPTAPAGNTFSHINNEYIYSDYFNNCADITYWHHYPNLGGSPYVVPVYSSLYPKISKVNNPYNIPYFKATACTTNIRNRSNSEINSSIAALNLDEQTYADSLDLLVDEGNTTSLNLDVATSIPPETMLLRSQLLQASPYLSDTVMVSAVEKEDVLPNSIITEVLTANPHSAKSNKILNKLDERVVPLNSTQISQIHSNDSIIGNKESLETNKSHYSNNKAISVYELVRLFMKDTTGIGINDSIEVALNNISTKTSRYQQAFCRFNNEDSLGVVSILNNIPVDFELDDYEINNNNNYIDYFEVLLKLQTQRIAITEIDSIQKLKVYQIMDNSDGLLHAYSRNLLMFSDKFVYNEPYIEVVHDTNTNKSSSVENEFYSLSDEINNSLKLYPNPAKEYVAIEYDFDKKIGNTQIEIITIDGVFVMNIPIMNQLGIKNIDIRTWSKGLYIIRLTFNGKTIQSSRFIKY